MTDTTINFSEAQEDARRLTKVTGRDVEVKSITCRDFDKNCECGGQGLVYGLVYGFCGHEVQDGDDLECAESDCEHKEYLAAVAREEAA